jgi:CRP-like cAMP-binding protein
MLANRVSELRIFDARTRLYAELLRLSRAATAGDGQAVISPPPTHSELAARVISNREAVTREISKLVKEGLLVRRRGALVLPDPARLARLVEKAAT